MTTEEKAIIIRKIIWRINCIMKSDNFHSEEDYRLSAFGICTLFHHATNEYPNSEELIEELIRDVEEANGITIIRDTYHKSFYGKSVYNVTTLSELELWYAKRLEALQKTLDYYAQNLEQ
ncbi:MAG: hypothetical protein LBE56_12290 [Tannerella sp.]|jgi:hypothetical protein|nr:hypothetical protein [Tannerella sp.]